jgi:hypothetical protein
VTDNIPAPRTVDDLAKAAKLLRVPKGDLLVLAGANDPFNVGTPAKVRAAEWFTGLWHRFGYTDEVHCRRVHYHAQSVADVRLPNGMPYRNTDECWTCLELAAKYARDLALIDPRRFADRRNPESLLYVAPRDPLEDGNGMPTWHAAIDGDRIRDLSGWQLPTIDPDTLTVHGFPTGRVEVDGYDYHHDDQPYLSRSASS